MTSTKSSGLWLALLASTILTGCATTLEKLDRIGQSPAQAAVMNPQEKPNYQPLSWPMPETPPPQKQYANSLWQPGARAFFRDGRAARVGDILRVNIQINDKAEVNNETQGKRDVTNQSAATKLLGFENKLYNYVPGVPTPDDLLNMSGNVDTKGKGTIKRQEKITTQVAALIVQVLPNGNFVIEGKQEMNINNELREVSVKGVIRPQDINTDNTVDSSQIAEARIIYGGRGQLTDVQQQRWGGQIFDAIAPF
jgi:flagellar L-ring protein precursor FlgH